MKYYLINLSESDIKQIHQLIEKICSIYSSEMMNISKSDFDKIMDYDVLKIMSLFYSYMDSETKSKICNQIENNFEVFGVSNVVYELSENVGQFYIPMSLNLIGKIKNYKLSIIIFDLLYISSSEIVSSIWDENSSYSNFLTLFNVAYFNALSYVFHMKEQYELYTKHYFNAISYNDLINNMFERHVDDAYWDVNVDLDLLENMIDDNKQTKDTNSYTDKDLREACNTINSLYHSDDNFKSKFNFILSNTNIKLLANEDIYGFKCYFTESFNGCKEYVIIYQNNTRLIDIIDVDENWHAFQKELYQKYLNFSKDNCLFCMIFILDNNYDYLPIQKVEGDRIYGRKYVFTETETINFINGIIKPENEDVSIISPVSEWDKILSSEHLSGCLTESYASRNVEMYIQGDDFDTVSVSAVKKNGLSNIPVIKWVKSLDTTGFRDFCFDGKNMEFGQINLFHGANGSGKTSVLEAIEYALTSEVSRVKSLKIKMPSDNYPVVKVCDEYSDTHRFTPALSKKNNREIERVWYGVPVGRTKCTLNENFNRFNSFDSEATYKFIHETDNSEETYSSLFGNLIFGETVVAHEKKWVRYKEAFEKRYSELCNELSNARASAIFYKNSISEYSTVSSSDELEKSLLTISYKNIDRLPKSTQERYNQLFEKLSIVKKYVDIILNSNYKYDSVWDINTLIENKKADNSAFVTEKNQASDRIITLNENNNDRKSKIHECKLKIDTFQKNIASVSDEIDKWGVVQTVLAHPDTIKLAFDLVEELSSVDTSLSYISEIEHHPVVIKFLNLDNYSSLSDDEYNELHDKLKSLQDKKRTIEYQYAEKKKSCSVKEQQSMELKKAGKKLLLDSKCPLCGHEYNTQNELIALIDNSIYVDNSINELLDCLQHIDMKIAEIDSALEREKIIRQATEEIVILSKYIPFISDESDYREIHDFYYKKDKIEERRNEIISMQTTLNNQGYSIKNITECKDYQNLNQSYQDYKSSEFDSYLEYLNDKLLNLQNVQLALQNEIASAENQILQNSDEIELLESKIENINASIDNLDMSEIYEVEQSLNNIKNMFILDNEKVFNNWSDDFYFLYDKTEYEVNRISNLSSLSANKYMFEECKKEIKRLEPKVERCAKAVQIFKTMPSLSSFVENSIKNNIANISKYFKWMHHSGEFVELGIDREGIYAIRGINNEKIRIYQMSTGQRATLAMSVMLTLHIAADNAPNFLLLDEPLATMDDTQVLNVLDILKSLVENKHTQIFFTTANSIMIDLFRKSFGGSQFDYKEYEFIKRINGSSQIIEHGINDIETF